jgi:hypothetical protein
VVDVHETPDRTLSKVPAGSGGFWIVQLAPSQRSASGVNVLPKSPGRPEYPTAMQSVADLHDTAVKAL